MNSSNTLIIIFNSLFNLYLTMVILRFLLQLVRADFYNPISQGIVKITNFPLSSMRKVIPSWGGFDLSSLLFACVVQGSIVAIIMTVQGMSIDINYLIAWSLIGVCANILMFYKYGLFVVILASWIAPNSYHPVLVLLHQLLEPVISPIKKILPNVGGLDFSPIVLLLMISVIMGMVMIPLARITHLPYNLILGL
jgi:YggT family protein